VVEQDQRVGRRCGRGQESKDWSYGRDEEWRVGVREGGKGLDNFAGVDSLGWGGGDVRGYSGFCVWC
jgi:hypothetical protein